MNEIMIVAAEASSSHFALRLMEHWKGEKRSFHFFGVGSAEMEAIGFERLGKSEEMAVVGAAEIIEHYGHLKSVFDRLVAEASRRRPKVIIVMDYPEFNLMLSKQLHALGLKVVYYVSPQVWVWRQGRVQTIKKYCQKMLVLFPFELPFYQSKGVPVEFVGHPILDELNEKYFDPQYQRQHRQRYGIGPDEIVLGLMPGSRRGEIKQHLKIQFQVAQLFLKNYRRIRIVLMVAPSFTKEQMLEFISQLAGDVDISYILIKDEPNEMIDLSDIVLAASGTATLMVGLLHKPMVIMYRLKWLTGIFARMVVKVRYFGIVNLILNEEVVPERFQGQANPQHLYELLKRYIDEPEYRQHVVNRLKELPRYLGNKGATARAAKAIEEFVE